MRALCQWITRKCGKNLSCKGISCPRALFSCFRRSHAELLSEYGNKAAHGRKTAFRGYIRYAHIRTEEHIVRTFEAIVYQEIYGRGMQVFTEYISRAAAADVARPRDIR